jgi:exonuclease III
VPSAKDQNSATVTSNSPILLMIGPALHTKMSKINSKSPSPITLKKKHVATKAGESINCASWNVRSLNNKVENVMNFLEDYNISIFFVTETWLTDQNNNTTARIKDRGYRVYHTSRNGKAGGGVGIIYKSSINLVKVFVNSETSFEVINAKLKLVDGSIVFCSCIYRPPGPLGHFLSDFEDFISHAFAKYKHFLLCGDVNMHLEKISAHIREWSSILSSFGLHQLV